MPGGLFPAIKRWWRESVRGSKGRGRPSSSKHDQPPGLAGLTKLPMELLIEISLIAASQSQRSYRTFSLVSKEFSSLVERECWDSLPIRLETTSAIISFHNMITGTKPGLAQRVHHLWIKGSRSQRRPKHGYSEPTAATWREFKASAFEQLHIIHSCTNLVSLACSFPVMFLCFRFTKDIFFKHDQLKELTLFENWNLWTCFALEPSTEGPHLFLQLTHLTILDNVAPHFPAQLFPSLQYLSAEMHTPSPKSVLEACRSRSVLEFPLPPNVRPLPRSVNVTLILLNDSPLGTRRVIGDDDRPWTIRIGNPAYFNWWSDRIRGGMGVWAEQ